MAGMVTTVLELRIGTVKKITFDWLSDDAAGTATGTTAAAYDGKIITLITDPGTAAPTDDYDVTVTDADGHDVLVGAGANRDTANTELVAEALLGAVAVSKLTVNISNAGNAKDGEVILYIR